MKVRPWIVIATASLLLGCPQEKASVAQTTTPARIAVQGGVSPQRLADNGTSVVLTLTTPPVTAVTKQGDRFGVSLTGIWTRTGTAPVYLQASDDAGHFVVPSSQQAPKTSAYRISAVLPLSTVPGSYAGTLSVRACADSRCAEPYQGATQSVAYTIQVMPAMDEWGTLQRTSKHDGYVPVDIDPTHYQVAWTYQSPDPGPFSGVVTDGNNIYYTADSVYARRLTDGAVQWRHVFTGSGAAGLSPPSVAGGVVYVALTAYYDGWMYALQATDGFQLYTSHVLSQSQRILNPTLRNGKAYVNAGYSLGAVYAFDAAGGSASWQADGGTYADNTPAADDDAVYAYDGATLSVYNYSAGSGLTTKTIGPNAPETYRYYEGTPMLGSADHVLVFNGFGVSRQLLDYSVAAGAMRWASTSLYSNTPAVANGVVYATSNESLQLDALDEATGRILWSWKAPYASGSFIGNVVVTDNMVFVSTTTQVYALDLRPPPHRRTWTGPRVAWSAPTPGTMSIAANRMLLVVAPYDYYSAPFDRITAYRLN